MAIRGVEEILAQANAYKSLAEGLDIYVARAEAFATRMGAVVSQNLKNISAQVAANEALAASKAKAAAAGTALSPAMASLLQDLLTRSSAVDAAAAQSSSMTTSQIQLPQAIKDAIAGVLNGTGNIGQLGQMLNQFFSTISTAQDNSGKWSSVYTPLWNDIGAILLGLGLKTGNAEFNPIQAPPITSPPPINGTPLSTINLGASSLQQLEAELGLTVTFTPG